MTCNLTSHTDCQPQSPRPENHGYSTPDVSSKQPEAATNDLKASYENHNVDLQKPAYRQMCSNALSLKCTIQHSEIRQTSALQTYASFAIYKTCSTSHQGWQCLSPLTPGSATSGLRVQRITQLPVTSAHGSAFIKPAASNCSPNVD